MRFRSQLVVGSPTLRVAAALTLATALLVALAGVVVVGASPEPVGPNPPAAFTGRISFGPCSGETTHVVDGVTKTRGEVCSTPVLEMSDPRLDGDGTVSADRDDYPDGLQLVRWALRIENDGGAWQQLPALTVNLDFPDGTYGTATITLVGEGGYEGLTAVAEAPVVDGIWSLDGFIFEGEIPGDTGDASP